MPSPMTLPTTTTVVAEVVRLLPLSRVFIMPPDLLGLASNDYLCGAYEQPLHLLVRFRALCEFSNHPKTETEV
jgi:hypothetical protein